MITSNAKEKIKRFNQIGLHYNLVADSVYRARNSFADVFDQDYLKYIIAGLISFDLGRMMGPDAKSRYDNDAGGFATKFEEKLLEIQPIINHLTNVKLHNLSLIKEYKNIEKAYNILAESGKSGLNQKGGAFHVGATKILHFINPEAFLIVDSNAARAFRTYHQMNFRNSTQPGYSADKYLLCMEHAQKDIITFGIDAFIALDKGTPITRIYDKLTFITGSENL